MRDWILEEEDLKAGKEFGSEAMMVMFRKIDRMFCDGEFEQANQDIQDIDLDRLSPTLLVGLLSITYAAKEHLPYRKQMALNIADRLKELVPDRWENLMKNRY